MTLPSFSCIKCARKSFTSSLPIKQSPWLSFFFCSAVFDFCFLPFDSSCIMPRRHKVSPRLCRAAKECAKLNLFIAHHVRVRRTTCFVLAYHVVCNTLFVFLFKIPGKERDAEVRCNAHSIEALRAPRAGQKIWLPNLHKNSYHLVAFF